MITKFARLEFELFTKPSKSDFLRIHQIMQNLFLLTCNMSKLVYKFYTYVTNLFYIDKSIYSFCVKKLHTI